MKAKQVRTARPAAALLLASSRTGRLLSWASTSRLGRRWRTRSGTARRGRCCPTEGAALGHYAHIGRPCRLGIKRDTAAAPTTLTEPRHTGRRVSLHACSLAPTRSAFDGAGCFGRNPSCLVPNNPAWHCCLSTDGGASRDPIARWWTPCLVRGGRDLKADLAPAIAWLPGGRVPGADDRRAPGGASRLCLSRRAQRAKPLADGGQVAAGHPALRGVVAAQPGLSSDARAQQGRSCTGEAQLPSRKQPGPGRRRCPSTEHRSPAGGHR
jgi:hypothetical protein